MKISLESGLHQNEEEAVQPKEDTDQYLSEIIKKAYGGLEDVNLEFYPEDCWELATIHFKNASVTISKEAKKLSHEERKELIAGLKEYRDNVRQNKKPEERGRGAGGSVYPVNRHFLIKESSARNVVFEDDAMQKSYHLQQVIDKNPTFPSDIRLVHSLALVEPPFERGFTGRKGYTASFFPYKTEHGSRKHKKVSPIGSYVVMPNVADSIQLIELMPLYGEGNPRANMIRDKLIQDGIIKSGDPDTVYKFINRQARRIFDSFMNAQKDTPSSERLAPQDLTASNVLIRLEPDEKTGIERLVYYKIDH